MQRMTVEYPDDLALAVQTTPDELQAQIRLMAALKMFELGKLSSGKAADLAGMSRVEFFEMCGRYRVSLFNYSARFSSSPPGNSCCACRVVEIKVGRVEE